MSALIGGLNIERMKRNFLMRYCILIWNLDIAFRCLLLPLYRVSIYSEVRDSDSYFDNVAGSWLCFFVDQMTFTVFSSPLWYHELLMLVSDCVCVTLASRSVNALISSADVSGAERGKPRLVRRGRQSSLSYKLWVQHQGVVLMNPSYLRWTIINAVYVPNNLYLIEFSKQFLRVHFPGLMLLSKLQRYAFYCHH